MHRVEIKDAGTDMVIRVHGTDCMSEKKVAYIREAVHLMSRSVSLDGLDLVCRILRKM